MNNPFAYTPDPRCLAAAEAVQSQIASMTEWREEVQRGKMFGVLIVRDSVGTESVLQAYSGQILGRADWAGWVPAVFDYLQPDGHFRRGEERISQINQQVHELQTSDHYQQLKSALQAATAQSTSQLEAYRRLMDAHKQRRQQWRADPTSVSCYADEAAVVRESQYEKAELRRLRRHADEQLHDLRQAVADYEQQIQTLKTQRRLLSDELQRWLFSHTVVLNARGEQRSVLDIWQQLPPAGVGDCCAPKLLQYAYQHGLQPLAIAEFWYGDSPRGEVRHHLSFYPACHAKCRPLLTFMLQGLDIEPERQPLPTTIPVLYEDSSIIIINKPADLLSVPGRPLANAAQTLFGSTPTSALELLSQQRPDLSSLYPVHRLDMQTSGILIFAKSPDVQRLFQRLFEERQVHKRYVAILDGVPSPHLPLTGTISLPLAADYVNRPRQCVDFEHGREAVTDYRISPSQPSTIYLYPHTGRTHQLRLHCSHPKGLGLPIVGDRLYGRNDGSMASRLMLHADKISFRHPLTGQEIEVLCPFIP